MKQYNTKCIITLQQFKSESNRLEGNISFEQMKLFLADKCKDVSQKNLETTNNLPKYVLFFIYDAMVSISSPLLHYLCSL